MVETVLERTGERFTLVVLAARRARQINSYFNQLGDGLRDILDPRMRT